MATPFSAPIKIAPLRRLTLIKRSFLALATSLRESLVGKVILIIVKRKLALTVQLSDPKDYEGGVFQCWFGGGGRFIDLPREKGDVLVMPTFIMHNVSPITKGERRALVYWTGGEPFR